MDERNELPQLPKGWVWTTIEEILSALESGGRPKGGAKGITRGVPSVGGEHLLYNGGFDFSQIRYVPEEYYEKMTRGRILANDVLVVKDGATTGKTSFVSENFPFKKAAVNEHVFILRVFAEFTSSKYLFYWMQSPFGQRCVDDNFQGTAQGGITSAFVRNSTFPLAPLPEQCRIVAKIEEIFSDLDAGVAALRKIQTQLKRYRQAVLKAAVEGKLTAEWRAANAGKIEPASALLERIRAARTETHGVGAHGRAPLRNTPMDAMESGALPEGWVYCLLADVAEVRLGRQRSPKRAIGPNMRRYLRAANVTWNGLALSDVKEMDFSPAEFEIYRLKRGDVLLSEASGSIGEVGKPAVWNEQIPNCCFQNTLIRVRSYAPLPTYLYVHFLFDALAERFRKAAKGVGIHHLGAENMSNWIISIPPLAEQQQIVAEVERRLSVADEIEKTVDASLKQAERLRQSILKRAFAGKLVPQDPSDEPAERLLERIVRTRSTNMITSPVRKHQKTHSRKQVSHLRAT
jgi:type I restriction enzyme S subunit